MNRWRFVISNMLMGSYWQARMFQDVLYLRLMYVKNRAKQVVNWSTQTKGKINIKNTF